MNELESLKAQLTELEFRYKVERDNNEHLATENERLSKEVFELKNLLQGLCGFVVRNT